MFNNFRLIASLLLLAPWICLALACNNEGGDENSDKKVKKMNTQIRDPHSYARPDEAVIKQLQLQIIVNFKHKIIEGKAMYKIENKSGGNKIWFDTQGLEIEKIHIGKDKLETTYELGPEDPILGQSLSVDITPETEFVTIYYKTSPGAAALQWLDPQQTDGKQLPFLFTQSQAILARSWIPIQDSPGIRFSYEAHVKVPREMMAVMSAENPQTKSPTGEYNFSMQQPIPAYLMALAAGDIGFREIGPRTGVYAEPGMLEASVYEFGEMEDMLIAAEKLYGAYSWGRYDLIVLPPSFPFGGMENPRLTFATPTILAGDRSLTSLVAHELAHSWSGNLVTNATWNDFWLNEGFTVYFERRIMEALYGKSYTNMLQKLGLQDLRKTIAELKAENKTADTRLKLDLEGRDPDEGLTDVAYEKGNFMLSHMEQTLGREKFDRFLKNYFETNAFRVMSTEGFMDYVDEHLYQEDESLKERLNLDEWIYQPGLPASVPLPDSNRFEMVEAELDKWLAGAKATTLNSSAWTTHEWLHFLRKLPRPMTVDQMMELDEAFNLTKSGNAEIIAQWLEHVILNQYATAYSKLEEFLVNVGRRKFLTPLYKALIKTEQGRQMALEIYEKARPNYHSVSYNTMDELLGVKP